MNSTTINYYDSNAEAFIKGTLDVDFSSTQKRFLSLLSGKKVLDFGCGSGRDTKYFLEQGYDVTATDGSSELCKAASLYTGIEVRNMLFQDLCEKSIYDGIWACSSILHLSKPELKDVLVKMSDALVADGIVYTSFKYGTFEGERNGRYFTDFTTETFTDFISGIKTLSVKEYWITGDVRPGREDEKWLNLILRKTNS
jgi:cyclopropane fatty-acyl-phospholipid synthase-like methyltransferase